MEVESKGLILSESQEIGKDATDVKEETDEKNAAKDVSTEMDSKTGPTSPARSNPSSPEPNCAICLGKLENKSFTDSCFHQFCFTCLLEWSKVKSVCPLCKTSFQSIIHNVKSIEEYDQYHVRHEQPTTWENPDGRRFRYRSTLTRERRRDIALRHIYMNHRLGHRTVPSATVSAVDTTRPSRRTRQTLLTHEGSDFRSQVYLRELRAIPHDQGHCVIRYRETTPRFFHENPACTHRLLPWLTRELNVLLYHNDAHVTFVLDIIMSLITRFDIRSQEFREHISPYIARRTDHFIHEFYIFARSPWDMATYDRNITYLDADRIESSGSDSDVVFVEEARPSVRVEPVEPAAQRHFYVDVENADTVHQPLASNWPLERVRLFLNNMLQEDSTQNIPLCTVTPMWARTEEVEDSSSASSEEINVTSSPSSPLPGPSGLSSTSLYKPEPDRSSPALTYTSVSSDDTISIRSNSAVPVDAVADDRPVDPEECLVVGVVKGVKERTPEIIDLVSSDDGKRNPVNGETTSGDAQPKKRAKRKKKKRSSSRSRSRKGSRSNGGNSPSRSGSSSSRHRKGHSSSSKSRRSGHRRHHSRSNNSVVDRSKSNSSHRHKKVRPRDHSNDQERGSGHDTR